MSTNLEKVELRDAYHDAMREMIEAKVAGKEIVTVADEVKPVIDIMSALRESVAQAKGAPMSVTTPVTQASRKSAAKAVRKKTSTAKKASTKRQAA